MLKKENRISKGYEFRRIHKYGKKFVSPFFYIYFLENAVAEAPSSFGIIVSNKTSKTAVKRNRLKRLFREIIRANFAKIKPRAWVVIHPKEVCLEKTYEELNSEFVKATQEISLTR